VEKIFQKVLLFQFQVDVFVCFFRSLEKQTKSLFDCVWIEFRALKDEFKFSIGINGIAMSDCIRSSFEGSLFRYSNACHVNRRMRFICGRIS
jgi:hypothetical protein